MKQAIYVLITAIAVTTQAQVGWDGYGARERPSYTNSSPGPLVQGWNWFTANFTRTDFMNGMSAWVHGTPAGESMANSAAAELQSIQDSGGGGCAQRPNCKDK
jgi:hypothetical protein